MSMTCISNIYCIYFSCSLMITCDENAINWSLKAYNEITDKFTRAITFHLISFYSFCIRLLCRIQIQTHHLSFTLTFINAASNNEKIFYLSISSYFLIFISVFISFQFKTHTKLFSAHTHREMQTNKKTLSFNYSRKIASNSWNLSSNVNATVKIIIKSREKKKTEI